MSGRLGAACILSVLVAAGCASAPKRPPASLTPRYPGYVEPVVPQRLRVSPALRQRHDLAWQWLQAGDERRAAREFQAVLKGAPGFFPSITGLGYVALAERNYKAAATQFAEAITADAAYLPAWTGRAEAEIALGDDAAAIAALERILDLDPRREGVKARLDLVRFRHVQTLIERGRAARLAGRSDDAQRTLEEALALSPSSTVILAELVQLEQQTDALDRAEQHARRLVQLDPGAADSLALLAGVLEGRGKLGEAATYYGRAAAIDPREGWRSKAASLREKAAAADLPEPVRTMASAATITRGDVAAYVGVKLAALLEHAPQRPPQVATDVRDHWAARWIPPVTRAGVMRIYENHTFQPRAIVRRGDLAQVVASLVELAAAGRPADLTRWRAARPRFADLPVTHVFYRPAALAVTAGTLTSDAGRFQSTRPATGAELVGAVDRILQLAQGR
ncbi:MAG: tetratricopeptide repeat protein [Acidobacteria bacterium]|nr:tetratricopeptide repeat protein [Acidobacteriota bacterium]